MQVLQDLLDHRGDGSVIVFGRTKHGVNKLARRLQADGYPVAALQGNLSQNARDRVMDDFRNGAGAGPGGDERRRARAGRQPRGAGDQHRAAGIAGAAHPPHRPHRPHGAAGAGDHPARPGGSAPSGGGWSAGSPAPSGAPPGAARRRCWPMAMATATVTEIAPGTTRPGGNRSRGPGARSGTSFGTTPRGGPAPGSSATSRVGSAPRAGDWPRAPEPPPIRRPSWRAASCCAATVAIRAARTGWTPSAASHPPPRHGTLVLVTGPRRSGARGGVISRSAPPAARPRRRPSVPIRRGRSTVTAATATSARPAARRWPRRRFNSSSYVMRGNGRRSL